MAHAMPLFGESPSESVISPLRELGAYEYLFAEKQHTFKSLADLFRDNPGSLPSDFVEPNLAYEFGMRVRDLMKQTGVDDTGVRIHGAGEYPAKLRHAKHPMELLYYRGTWELSEMKSVAIVGARKASEEGVKRARQLSNGLSEMGFAIVSGLAHGIDVAAHVAAIENGKPTIAVIGTPLSESYPKENADIQEYLARAHLVISQVPFLAYRQWPFNRKRSLFPERNATMSAISDATVIVEASDTSGTLTQARAAFQQGRKLFILNSCFENRDISWPAKFEKKGAIRVKTLNDIAEVLNAETSTD